MAQYVCRTFHLRKYAETTLLRHQYQALKCEGNIRLNCCLIKMNVAFLHANILPQPLIICHLLDHTETLSASSGQKGWFKLKTKY